MDHPCAGAGRRHEPGRGGEIVGTAQELGVPAAGADRAVREPRPRTIYGGPVVADGGAADRAVAGGQLAEVLEAIRRETLTTAELAGVVDLWFGCAAEQRQQEYLLRHPREALSQAKGTLPTAHAPRLSEDGNRVW